MHIIDDIRTLFKISRAILFHESITLHGQVSTYAAKASDIIPIFNPYFESKRVAGLPSNVQNLIVTVGKEAVLDYLIGGTNGDFYEVGVGTGTNAPSAGDVALQTALLWKVATDRYRVSTDGFVGVTFAAGEANATWKEAGVRNRAGVLISRAAVNQAKTIDYVVTVEWKYSW